MEVDSSPVTVLIAASNEVARIGLRALLNDDPRFAVVGDTAREALALTLGLRPDLVVLDPAVEGRLDISSIRELRDCCPESRLCIRTSVFDPHSFFDAMEAGALGYVLKADNAAALLCDVLPAHAGEDGGRAHGARRGRALGPAVPPAP